MNIDLLRRLCETPGVPGHEHRVRDLIQAEIKGLFDEVTVDPMGSLLCRRDSRKASRREPRRRSCFCATWMRSASWSHMSRTRASFTCSRLVASMPATVLPPRAGVYR